MELKEESYGWRATDGSNVVFNQKERPIQVEACIIGHSGLVQGPTKSVKLENLTHLISLPGGVRGPEGRRWTNEYQTFAIYRHKVDIGKPEIFFSQMHGCGPCFAIVSQLDFERTFSPIVNVLDNNTLYDIVHAMMGSYQKGVEDGGKAKQYELYRAFAEGKMKKRKKRGESVYKVFVTD